MVREALNSLSNPFAGLKVGELPVSSVPFRPRRAWDVMARRYAWRALGVGLFALAGALRPAAGGIGALHAIIRFLLAVAGAVLLVQGRRVPLALRVERGRHRDLPHAIHAGRMERKAAKARASRRDAPDKEIVDAAGTPETSFARPASAERPPTGRA